jgi:hypothetical protein
VPDPGKKLLDHEFVSFLDHGLRRCPFGPLLEHLQHLQQQLRGPGSPAAALFTSCFDIASSLVMVLRRPPSFTVTASCALFSSTVAKFFESFTRPAGLPDFPFLKRLCRGVQP